jgi:hypothetical protein
MLSSLAEATGWEGTLLLLKEESQVGWNFVTSASPFPSSIVVRLDSPPSSTFPTPVSL